MSLITIAQTQHITDSLAGQYEDLGSIFAPIVARLTSLETYINGDGTGAHPSLGNVQAQYALGPAVTSTIASLLGSSVYQFATAKQIAKLTSYFSANGGVAASLPATVLDVVSYVRYSNGCPDPSPAANGAGSNFAYLLHPSFRALLSILTGGSTILPNDVVFAPTGVVLGTFNAATAAYTAGTALMSSPGPYAPAKLFGVLCGATPPNGSMYVTVTGLTQSGASKTWRGDVGTGLTAAGQTLAPGVLQGTSGGTNGGTAAPTDQLVSITNIQRDSSVSSGGTATAGIISVITFQERASL